MTTRLAAAIAAAVLIIAVAGPAIAQPGGLRAMPGETPLTKDQKDEALHHMPPGQRAKLEKAWADPNNLPVSFVQAYYRIEKDGRPLRVDTTPGRLKDAPNFHVANLASASHEDSEVKYDLYISHGVYRQSCSGCYRWAIDNYADWRGAEGMANWGNDTEDDIGTSWTGNMTLAKQTRTGRYIDGVGLDIVKSKVTPGEGISWSFHEWKPSWIPGGIAKPVNWADGTAYVTKTRWSGSTGSAAMLYNHTKGDGTNYSLSFLNASISVSPTGGKWTLAAHSSFRY